MRPAVGTGRADADFSRNPQTGTAYGFPTRISGNRQGEIAARNASLSFPTIS